LPTASFDVTSPQARFRVLVNDEEQYSLWPADLNVPGGWTDTGVRASKQECDRYLESVWTDQRPRSLRAALDDLPPRGTADAPPPDDLTRRLATWQPVEVGGPDRTPAGVRARLEEAGTLFVRFSRTRGGTDLAVRLDPAASDVRWTEATAHVEGTLILNGHRVRCVADLDLTTLRGTGRLVGE
jgi:MbtH protein